MRRIDAMSGGMRRSLGFSPLQYMLDTAQENPRLASFFEAGETYACLFRHMLFLGGGYDGEAFRFITQELLDVNHRARQPVLYVFAGDPAWERAFQEKFPGKGRVYARSLYGIKPVPGEIALPETVREIRGELPLDNFGMIRDEVLGTGTYNDMDDFFSRGICFAPVIDAKVCGFCTSEYPSQNAVAIGIEVLEEYQRRGYAKAMTRAFLSKAAQRDLFVYWECWSKNLASVRTALACGFQKQAEHEMLLMV